MLPEGTKERLPAAWDARLRERVFGMAGDARTVRGPFSFPGFSSFWWAATASSFGTYVTTLALQVLVVDTLGGTAFDVGLVNGARWVPYLLLGLVLGAVVDRIRRKPLLVATDAGRAVLLVAIPALSVLGVLSVPVLIGFVIVFGLLSLLNDAAHPSFLTRLVPPSVLLRANARLDQSGSVAQTSGPAIAGALVTAVGAPLAVLVDAATYLFSAVATSRISVVEPPPRRTAPVHLRRDVAEGMRWVYRHRMLAPQAISRHAWFVFNAMLGTAFVPFVLLGLGLTAFELGLALAAAGLGGLFGALASARLGLRLGVGWTVVGTQVLGAVGWIVIALAPAGTAPGSRIVTVAVLAVGQFVFGVSLGASNANEMGYQQSVTPDGLQSRMNTTIRSVNRAAIVLGAPLGGLLADGIGFRPTLLMGATGFVVAAVALALSPFRGARHGDPVG